MARKGQFKKGGGRVGSSHKSHSRKRSKARRSHAMTHAPRTHTVTKTRKVYVKASHRRRSGKSGGGGGISVPALAITAAVLGYATSAKTPIAAINEYTAKVPGAATFGNAATLGMVAGGINHFILKKKNKWLRLAGYIGVGLAALKLGSDNTDFKFLGDDDVGDYDVGDADDDDDDDDDGDD